MTFYAPPPPPASPTPAQADQSGYDPDEAWIPTGCPAGVRYWRGKQITGVGPEQARLSEDFWR
jgi:hypothetical protein